MTTSEAGPVLERNPEFCFHFSLGLHPDVPEGLKCPSLEALFFPVLRCPRSRSLVLQPSCVKSPPPARGALHPGPTWTERALPGDRGRLSAEDPTAPAAQHSGPRNPSPGP